MIKAILLSVIVGMASGPYGKVYEGKVVEVVDGNTLKIEIDGEGVVKFKLEDVDCPEVQQQFGDEAKSYTEKLVYKKKVEVEYTGKDRWGNRLAIVKFKRDKNLNEILIREGYAWANPSSNNEYKYMQGQAKNNKEGLWTSSDPTPPWIFRRQQTMMSPKSR